MFNPLSSRRNLALAAGAAVILVVVGAYAFLLPGKVRSDVEKGTREHLTRINRSVTDLYDTFSPELFAFDDDELLPATGSPERYARVLSRVAREEQRQVAAARAQLEATSRMLAREGPRLPAPASWPALGATGEVRTARDISRDAQAYRREAMRLIEDYAELLTYKAQMDRIQERADRGVALGTAPLVRLVSRPVAAQALGRTAARLEPLIEKVAQLRPQRGFRKERARAAALLDSDVRGMRKVAAAWRVGDRIDVPDGETAARVWEAREMPDAVYEQMRATPVQREFDSLQEIVLRIGRHVGYIEQE